MSLEEQVFQWFANLANIAFGFLIGSIITGWFTLKIVVPRMLKIKEVHEFLSLFREVTGYLKGPEYKELLDLFREGKGLFKEAIPLLKEIIENQKEEEKQEENRGRKGFRR